MVLMKKRGFKIFCIMLAAVMLSFGMPMGIFADEPVSSDLSISEQKASGPALETEGDTCCIDGCDVLLENGGFASYEEIEVDGQKEKFYHIATAENLDHIRHHLGGYSEQMNFKQVANIDLSEYSDGWTPIGLDEGQFYGKYIVGKNDSGQYYKIEHLKIIYNKAYNPEEIGADRYLGLFSYLDSSAHVEGVNLSVDSVDITTNEAGGEVYFGGIAGEHNSPRTIENCHVTYSGDITVNDETNGEVYFETYIGGIVGKNDYGVIKDCSVTNLESSKISLSGQYVVVGGISAINSGGIYNSDHNGPLNVETQSATYELLAGGIVGILTDQYAYSSTIIENCQNNGVVSALNRDDSYEGNRACSGGIVGYIYSNETNGEYKVNNEYDFDIAVPGIINCANISADSQVKAEAPTAIAGGVAGASRFIPEAHAVILNCYNNSDVNSILIPEKPLENPESLQQLSKKGACIGAASGGIIGASGGILSTASYSAAKTVTADASALQDNIEPAEGLMSVSEGQDEYAGGIAGLVWGTEFHQNYYLKNTTVTTGIGGNVIDYNTIEPIEDTVDEVAGYTTAQLNHKDNFGDLWLWYEDRDNEINGEAPQYYNPEFPWRIADKDGYPVLRGKPYTGSNDSGSSGGGRSSAAVLELQVTFLANDGTNKVIAKKSVAKSGNTVTLPEEPVREGYTFIGWNLKEDGKGFTFTELYEVDKSMSVYAQWERNVDLANSKASKYFKDIDNLPWALLQIDDLHEKGVVEGIGNQLYKPDSQITRADFMLMLVRAYGLNAEFKDNFADVPTGAYYYDAVGIAKALEIAEGDGSNFRPNDPITRQDAMTLAHRTLSVIGFTLEPGNDGHLSQFSDMNAIAAYAKAPLATLAQAKVITGSDGKIHPKDYTTRAEMALILYRMLNL